MAEKVFIIAEAGVNHNGSLKIAKKMVDAASNAGADAIKFQTFKTEYLATRFAPKAKYQLKTVDKNENQFEMLKKLELSYDEFRELAGYCNKKKIKFLSTPFDLKSIEFLKRLGLSVFKIPSGEITNLPYLEKIGSLRKKVILSSGMSDLEEIRAALNILIKAGTRKKDITVLHCNTEYPTPFKDANLKAIVTIKNKFRVNVGYSDHTLGIEAAIAAVSLGAAVIEKHFTLDKDMEGPDHRTSLEPCELKNMIEAIRNIEIALGTGIKKPSRSESRNIALARKSIVASRDINKGDIFSEDNITVKRPGTGMSPMKWNEVLGKIAKRYFRQDELIEI